jgi:hypothetical protein
MKTPLSTFLLAAGLLQLNASCVRTEQEKESTTKDPRSIYVPPTGAGHRISSSTVLNTVRTTHSFSDPKTKDNFQLQMRGPRILSSRLHLIVTTAKGDTLRHEVLPAKALLASSDERDSKLTTVRGQEIAVLHNMNTFFTEDHFSRPAVPSTATQPAELTEQDWASLRTDPSGVGFEYPSASGMEKRLAYSRKLGRAIVLGE